MSGTSPTLTPVMTAVTSTSLPQATSQPTLSTFSSGSTSLPVTLAEVLSKLGIKQQCLKVPGLRLVDLSLVRQ